MKLLKDLIDDFDNFKQSIDSVKKQLNDGTMPEDLDNEDLWIKYEKDWPEHVILPDLGEIEIPENYTLCTDINRVKDVYSCSRLRCINGFYTPDDIDQDVCDSLYCDYCRTPISSDNFYNCAECHADMCELCFQEKTEEIAIANGAKNYHKRKELLNVCFAHSDKLILIVIKEYFTNLFKDIENIIQLVPIIADNEDNFILMNCNPESKKYKSLYLYNCDNHGRRGIFESKIHDLQELLNYLTTLQDDPETDGWSSFYDAPIKKYLEELKCPTYYG